MRTFDIKTGVKDLFVTASDLLTPRNSSQTEEDSRESGKEEEMVEKEEEKEKL